MGSNLLNGVLENVLVFAPHSDDDILGCGGLIRKVVKSGGKVHVVLATVGDVRFYHSNKVIKAETRIKEFETALDYLGVNSTEIMYTDHEQVLDTVPMVDLVTKMDKIIHDVKPSAVLIPYPSFHQDHKAVYNACFAALRPTNDTGHIKMVAMYEYPFIVWDTIPIEGGRLHIDITDEIDDKVHAMSLHKSQVRPEKHLISLETIKVWAQRRGLEVGVPYAEAYKVLRMVV